MKKRTIALLLCIASLVAVFAGCAKGIDPTSEYKGQQIAMYLSETIYDLDPANAYVNESTKDVVSLLFDTLFTLDEKGKVKKSLVDEYEIDEKKNKNNGTVEYYMYITLDDTCWSDGTPISADDVVFAWKRVLSYTESYSAAPLLFDIKNARAYNRGDVSEDDIGLTADRQRLTIQFEGKIDYDQFMLNLTSLALAPLREDVVSKGDDWAKKPSSMVTSGPYKLARISFSNTNEPTIFNNYMTNEYGEVLKDNAAKKAVINSFILERNAYYYRSTDVNNPDYLDKFVKPYRLVVDCAMSDADILEAYKGGTIMYLGDIPVSIRGQLKDSATTKDYSMSTTTLYFNLNEKLTRYVEVKDSVPKTYTREEYDNVLFTNPKVRQALSMALDRDSIANKLVFAKAATGIVPTGVFESNSAKELFRDNSSNNYSTLKKNVTKAQELLASAGVNPAGQTITLTYAIYDDAHKVIAEEFIKPAWEALGFTVELNGLGAIINNDYDKYIQEVPTDVCDDTFAETLKNGEFEVILLDYVAISADPFSVLAPFAKDFSGTKMDMSDPTNYQSSPHISGYDSKAYNEKIETAFKQKDPEKRVSALHAAEDILMNDMPIVPIVFNNIAYVANEELDFNNTKFFFWNKATNYYGVDNLKLIQVDDYDAYLDTCEAFYAKKFDTYKQNPLSYFGGKNFKDLTFEQFKEETTNYSYLFKRLKDYKMSVDE